MLVMFMFSNAHCANCARSESRISSIVVIGIVGVSTSVVGAVKVGGTCGGLVFV